MCVRVLIALILLLNWKFHLSDLSRVPTPTGLIFSSSLVYPLLYTLACFVFYFHDTLFCLLLDINFCGNFLWALVGWCAASRISHVLNIILSLVCLWTVAWSEGLVWFPCYSLMSVCADFCLLRFCMGYGYLIIFLSMKCSLFCFHFHLWLQILSLLFGKFWRCGYLLKYYLSPWFFFGVSRILWREDVVNL